MSVFACLSLPKEELLHEGVTGSVPHVMLECLWNEREGDHDENVDVLAQGQ